MLRYRSVLLGLLIAGMVLTPASGAAASVISIPGHSGAARFEDPVVLTGAQAPALLTAIPSRVVAFAWTGRRWRQFPVQVDERAVVDLGQVYHGTRTGIPVSVYTDPNTFTGPDPDPRLDANDEIAFMDRDTGRRAAHAGRPAGVLSAPATTVRVHDPIGGGTRYAYLFLARSSKLSPGAGRDYVNYKFALAAGDYRTKYRFSTGPNPETSTVTTPYWSAAFGDRWTFDDLRVTAGRATGADVLDRLTAQFAPTTCTRSEQTFRTGEGAFIANIDGPVRAIRSYIGANSGPFTERDQIMYDRRQDIRTFLRVHPIPGVMDLMDWSRAALGMQYRNSLQHNPVTVDGVPDAVVPGAADWEQITGKQGTVTSIQRYDAMPAGTLTTTFRLDQFAPPPSTLLLCTGDGDAIGESGARVTSAIPNTDPAIGPAADFRTVRTLYMDPPGGGVAQGNARSSEARAGLTTRSATYRPG